MPRCTRTTSLEVHHIRRDGGNDLGNAQVLCHACHVATITYGNPGHTPPAFSRETIEKALKNAGYRCECTSNRGCH